jgi:3'(2'), 5'-bisphosphate nucleotidase
LIETININNIKQIALKAGDAIMKIYQKDFQIEYKDDNSPLTEADKKSNEIICNNLITLYPDIPILSEENKQIPYEIRKDWNYYWCIDPIDGTKEFIKKNDEFTVNIALIHKNTPVIGVVYAPVLRHMYYAKQNQGAYKEIYDDFNNIIKKNSLPLNIHTNFSESLTVVASKSHLSTETQKFIDDLESNTQNLTLTSKGSSLKLCMIAEGIADIYPRIAPTMEWDTAAAHIIVKESGKNVYLYDENINANDYLLPSNQLLEAMTYNKNNLLNSSFVVA